MESAFRNARLIGPIPDFVPANARADDIGRSADFDRSNQSRMATMAGLAVGGFRPVPRPEPATRPGASAQISISIHLTRLARHALSTRPLGGLAWRP